MCGVVLFALSPRAPQIIGRCVTNITRKCRLDGLSGGGSSSAMRRDDCDGDLWHCYTEIAFYTKGPPLMSRAAALWIRIDKERGNHPRVCLCLFLCVHFSPRPFPTVKCGKNLPVLCMQHTTYYTHVGVSFGAAGFCNLFTSAGEHRKEEEEEITHMSLSL